MPMAMSTCDFNQQRYSEILLKLLNSGSLADFAKFNISSGIQTRQNKIHINFNTSVFIIKGVRVEINCKALHPS